VLKSEVRGQTEWSQNITERIPGRDNHDVVGSLRMASILKQHDAARDAPVEELD
jgi:hypothetical protein